MPQRRCPSPHKQLPVARGVATTNPPHNRFPESGPASMHGFLRRQRRANPAFALPRSAAPYSCCSIRQSSDAPTVSPSRRSPSTEFPSHSLSLCAVRPELPQSPPDSQHSGHQPHSPPTVALQVRPHEPALQPPVSEGAAAAALQFLRALCGIRGSSPGSRSGRHTRSFRRPASVLCRRCDRSASQTGYRRGSSEIALPSAPASSDIRALHLPRLCTLLPQNPQGPVAADCPEYRLAYSVLDGQWVVRGFAVYRSRSSDRFSDRWSRLWSLSGHTCSRAPQRGSAGSRTSPWSP